MKQTNLNTDERIQDFFIRIRFEKNCVSSQSSIPSKIKDVACETLRLRFKFVHILPRVPCDLSSGARECDRFSHIPWSCCYHAKNFILLPLNFFDASNIKNVCK